MSPTNYPSARTIHKVAAQSSPAYLTLSPDLVSSFKSSGRVRNWRRGQTVVHYGQSLDCVSICLSGQFSVSLSGEYGHSQLLRYMVDGELFGVPSVFANALFPTDLVCVKDGSTLEVSKVAFEDRLRRDPNFAIALIQNLSSRVAELFSLMEADLLPSLKSRVLKALRRLSTNQRQAKPSSDVVLQLSQADIASAVHASRQKVHQELKRLENDGLIKLGYRNITLHKHFFS